MARRTWVLVMLAAMACVGGCSEFNTNLTTQTNSSNISFITPTSTQAGHYGNGLCPASGTCFTLTVNGNGFSNGADVQWTTSAGNTVFQTCSPAIAAGIACTIPACTPTATISTPPDCTTFVSTTQLTVPLTAADIAAPGAVQVAVLIPGSAVAGASGSFSSNTTELSNFVLFNVNAAPAMPPTITMLSPSEIGAGSSAFTLSVTGTGFVTGTNSSVLYWTPSAGGPSTPLTTIVNSATSLSAQIPASLVASIGTANLSVSNAASSGASSTPALFTITSAAPTIASRYRPPLMFAFASPAVRANLATR